MFSRDVNGWLANATSAGQLALNLLGLHVAGVLTLSVRERTWRRVGPAAAGQAS